MTSAPVGGREATASASSGVDPSRIVIQPNGSLSPKAALVFFTTMFLVQATIVTGFWLAMDAWLILPFAGVELAILAAALLWSQKQNQYREVVTIGNGEVAVERGYNTPEHSWQAAIIWAKVVVESPPGPRGKVRLLLRSAGKNCEIGVCLTDADKLALAARLKALMREHAY